jgi:hypothetical protein
MSTKEIKSDAAFYIFMGSMMLGVIAGVVYIIYNWIFA